MEGVWEHMTGSSFHKNCPPWKPARLPTDIHRRRFFANFNRHCRARWQSFSLASHTPMRFFISPSQCIPVRQPRGDTATHEGHRRVANVAMKWGGGWEGRAGGEAAGRKGSRDIFNYQPEVPTLPLPSTTRHQLPNISGVSLDGSRTHHPPTPYATLSRPSSSYLPNYFRLSRFSRLRYDCRICMISPTEFSI